MALAAVFHTGQHGITGLTLRLEHIYVIPVLFASSLHSETLKQLSILSMGTTSNLPSVSAPPFINSAHPSLTSPFSNKGSIQKKNQNLPSLAGWGLLGEVIFQPKKIAQSALNCLNNHLKQAYFSPIMDPPCLLSTKSSL